ncbi:hypothetical protein D3C80_2011570 [compost metagenome]
MNTLTQLIHRIDMIHPFAVYRAKHNDLLKLTHHFFAKLSLTRIVQLDHFFENVVNDFFLFLAPYIILG